MTKEQHNLANDYVHDIQLLDSIRKSQLKDHWVEFSTPDRCDGSAYSDAFIEDFEVEEWVQKEKEKLEKLFEEL